MMGRMGCNWALLNLPEDLTEITQSQPAIILDVLLSQLFLSLPRLSLRVQESPSGK